MVSTTARTAGKPAKFLSRTAVGNDLKNLHMRMDADVRLAAAAGGVARFLADAAGLENPAVARLQSTVVAACTEAFEHLTRLHPYLDLEFSRYTDRIEIALSHEGAASPGTGRNAITEFGKSSGKSSPGSSAFSGVDRVQYETRGGEVVTRLIKYLGQDNISVT